MELFVAAALLLIESLLLLRALGQRAALRALPRTTRPGADPGTVEAIVPARNEALNIRECLEGLAAQIYPAEASRIPVTRA